MSIPYIIKLSYSSNHISAVTFHLLIINNKLELFIDLDEYIIGNNNR